MKFHRVILVALLMLYAAVIINAQDITYGLTGGLNGGTPVGKTPAGASGKPSVGTVLGLFLKYKLSEYFKIESALTYSNKGASFKTPISGDTNIIEIILGQPHKIPIPYSGTVAGVFENKYIDLPVLLAIRLSKKINFLIGPQLSYLFKGKNTGKADLKIGIDPNNPYTIVNNEPFDESSQINRWDYGIAGGVNYKSYKRFSFDLKVTSGLRSIYKDGYSQPDGTVRNVYMQCSVGYRIGHIKQTIPDE